MWLGGMDRISHHHKGESNQPQSLATGSRAFESQCFISKHKLLDRRSFFFFFFIAQGCVQKKRLSQQGGVKEAVVFTFVMSPPDPEVDFCGSRLAAAVVEAIMFVGCLIDFFPLWIASKGRLGEILSILTKYPLGLKNDHILSQWYSNFWAAPHGGGAVGSLRTLSALSIYGQQMALITVPTTWTPLRSGPSLSKLYQFKLKLCSTWQAHTRHWEDCRNRW